MEFSERLQQLRKARGLSQEELADELGVSRQAVSKWESAQSLPDLEKAAALCRCLDTTADYLLRGIEPDPRPSRDAIPYAIAATAVDAIGLIAAVSLWGYVQEGYATGVGLAVMVAGLALFFLGQALGERGRERARAVFWPVNLWFLSLIPYSLAFNTFCALLGGYFPELAPIPLPYYGSLPLYALGWLLWLALCAGADWLLLRRRKK